MATKSKLVDFRAVRAAVSMERVLGHYGLLDPMKRTGDNLSGCCPIHKGSNPTQFRVSVSKNLWNCFSECKRGGNVIDFIALMEGVSAYGAALKAIEWFNLDAEQVQVPAKPAPDRNLRPAPQVEKTAEPVSSPPPDSNPGAETFNPPLKFRLEKLQRDHPYLIERGLTAETRVEFDVGFCAKGMLAGRIAIPIHNVDGQIVAYGGRWPGDPPDGTPKYELPPGFRKSLEVFHLDRARQEPAEEPLIVVEGFFDAIKLHQLGHRKVVALMGCSLASPQEDLIRRYTTRDSRILVMLDEDDAGRAGRDDLASRFARFAYVRVHAFEQEGNQPEHLTAERLAAEFA